MPFGLTVHVEIVEKFVKANSSMSSYNTLFVFGHLSVLEHFYF